MNGRLAAFSGLFLSFLAITTALGLVCLLIAALAHESLASGRLVLAGGLTAATAAVIATTLAPMVYRYAARALPLKASGKVRPSAVWLLLSATVAALVGCVYLAAAVLETARYVSSNCIYGGQIGRCAAEQWDGLWLFGLTVALFGLASVAYALTRITNLHRRPHTWRSSGFILFLRSFGSIADSAALGPLVKAARAKWRVAFLSSPKELTTSWDPKTLALSGLNLRQPFHSTPVYLESTESSWRADIRDLAGSARLVVIDTSNRTPGLSEEMKMLQAAGLDHKTIRLQDVEATDVTADPETPPRTSVVSMERSNLTRLPSLAFGFTFTYLGFVVLTAVLANAAQVYGLVTINQEDQLFYLSFFYSVIPGVWTGYALAPRAGFSARSSERLIRAVRQALTEGSRATE